MSAVKAMRLLRKRIKTSNNLGMRLGPVCKQSLSEIESLNLAEPSYPNLGSTPFFANHRMVGHVMNGGILILHRNPLYNALA